MAGAAMSGFLLLSEVALIVTVLIGAVRSDHNHGGSKFTIIDSGIPDGGNCPVNITGIQCNPDSVYIRTGTNHNISDRITSISIQERTLRSFPQGEKNCYTLPVQRDKKYLIRASFLHGSYDGQQSVSKSNPIVFDLYLGVNLWTEISISNASFTYGSEVITGVPLDEFMAICLVNKGRGTPFISSLEFGPLEASLYPHATELEALITYERFNFGPANYGEVIRSPSDPYDRLWRPFGNISWNEISTNSTVQPRSNDVFEVPSAVLQTAVAPTNSTELFFSWPPPRDAAVRLRFHIYMHFAEIQSLAAGKSRAFDIYLNGDLHNRSFSPEYLLASSVAITDPNVPDQYNFLLKSTASSTLPPTINAVEVYSVLELSKVPTDAADVSSIRAIRDQYKVDRNWMGDPCVPKEYTWDGLDCSYTDGPRITFLNLSSSGLNGTIDASFGQLKSLRTLDLSYNNLTGEIPPILAELPSLASLNLTSNQLSGLIPSALLQKKQDGSLKLGTDGNPNLCTDGTSCLVKPTSTGKKLGTPVIVILCIVAVMLLLLVIVVIWRLRRPQGWRRGISGQLHYEDGPMPVKEHQDDSFQLENRQFTYMQLKNLTNNFERVLGSGAFGTVYHGYLDDGTQVAVKMRSQTSSQGTKEFLAEAQHLTRVHHRNLVSMIGYCKDREYQAVIYEYMPQGTLQDHLQLQGKAQNSGSLSWVQRLCIAVDAAQGLEYLHKMCQPPLIHRDVKTGNILLSETLEAKIADFGLSKIFQSEGNSHMLTAVVGTPGYLDPEYYTTFQLSEKSDVYSFGVVLLELITGRPPISPGTGSPHIVQWVRQGLARGNIEEIVDPRLQQGEYNVNCVWKCADVAMECVSLDAHQRPTMAEVVVHLKESLELEAPLECRIKNSFARDEYTSQTSVLAGGMSVVSIPPSAR